MSRTLSPAAAATILFEGDSLTRFAGRPNLDTWAWMRLTGAHYGYPEKVSDWIFCNRPDLRLNLRVGASGGSTMQDILDRFDGTTAPMRPTIVVMTVGTNDANRKIPLTDFRAQATAYCRQLQDLCGGRVLYLGGLKAAHGAGEGAAERMAFAAAYFDTMAEVCEAHGGLAVDLGTILVRKAAVLAELYKGHSIYHDGLHFSPLGNEIIAGVVLRALGLITMPGDPDWPA